METHPPEPLFVHRLPSAPHFVGREPELDELLCLWKSGVSGVVALVGLGGAGKTAVAAQFLDRLQGAGMMPRPYGLFVWSFYQEPDPEQFLQRAHAYFVAGASTAPARGVALVGLLRNALAQNGPHLLVLDGLERVQRQDGDATAAYGQIEDPLLKQLVLALSDGSETMVMITSRFPLTDLEVSGTHDHGSTSTARPAGHRQIDVGGLSAAAAFALLRARGVRGDDADLEKLVTAYGAHALTLDHLGGLIGQFLDGDPRRAPEAPVRVGPGEDRQALRLVRLLRAYEQHLPPAELALLCRLCLLRRSATVEQILSLFLCSPGLRARTVRELPARIRQATGGGKFAEHNLHDLAEATQDIVQEALCAAPIAGPEEHFLQEMIQVAQTIEGLQEQAVDARIAEIVRLYRGVSLDVPTDRRPLPVADRARLRQLCERYMQLRGRLRPKETSPPPALELAFKQLGYGENHGGSFPEDVHPAELPRALGRVRDGLRQLAFKHAALQRVRELCRRLQRKWTLAGPLAPLERNELLLVLNRLVGRHLVLRESDGSFSAHPAIRDHFARVGTMTEQGNWHDLIREQLVRLVQRPGMRRPEDPATLDLVEDAIYHTVQAGRTAEAIDLYENILGGLRHLGWKLGEMARGVRILRSFPTCPDRWALGWFLRALGEYEEALAHHPLPCFRADVRLLQGRLPHVAAEGDETRTAIAAFLMGQTDALPPDRLACAVPRQQLLLLRGPRNRPAQSWARIMLYDEMGWLGERVRYQLLHAETYRALGDLGRCREHIAKAAHWIVWSGSVEHLCLLQLMQARLERTAGDGEPAQRAVEAGIRLARQCGLGLYLVELLNEQAEICIARADYPAAEHFAATALERAQSPDCQFLWGAAEAGHLLGLSLLRQGELDRAKHFLTQALDQRGQLNDPKVEQTRQLLLVS